MELKKKIWVHDFETLWPEPRIIDFLENLYQYFKMLRVFVVLLSAQLSLCMVGDLRINSLTKLRMSITIFVCP